MFFDFLYLGGAGTYIADDGSVVSSATSGLLGGVDFAEFLKVKKIKKTSWLSLAKTYMHWIEKKS